MVKCHGQTRRIEVKHIKIWTGKPRSLERRKNNIEKAGQYLLVKVGRLLGSISYQQQWKTSFLKNVDSIPPLPLKRALKIKRL